MKKVWSAINGYMHITDKWLMLFCLVASALSVLLLTGLYNSDLSNMTRIVTQTGAVLIGLAAAIVISCMDYNILLKLWKIYLPLCLILVAATFVVGKARGGDQAWLEFSLAGRSFSLQPSELLKISFITTMALHISKVEDELNRLPNVLLLCLHGGLHIVVINFQDSGTALIYAVIFLIMLFCAGIQWRYILVAAGVAAAMAPILWNYVLSEYHRMRILIIFNPELDPDYAYQQLRSAIALGTGGIEGTGLFAGKHVPVPEVYNDFIFSFIGESLGFMGCIGTILLLLAIALKVLYNSSIAKDTTGRFICIGVFAMISSQTIVNVGMCLGVMPVIGVTLPFLSCGGTAVLSMYIGLGLVLSVYSHSNTALFYEK